MSAENFRFQWHGDRRVAAVLAVICVGLIVAALLTDSGPWGDLAWPAGILAALLALEIDMEAAR